jgi:hypothetical protein
MLSSTRRTNRDKPEDATTASRNNRTSRRDHGNPHTRRIPTHQHQHSCTPEVQDEEEEAMALYPITIITKFNPSDHKLDSATAMRKFAQTNFPKLSGPTNFMDWQTEFKRAMIMSNYWGFFDKRYDEGVNTAWYEAGYQQAMVFLQESCTKEKAMEIQYDTDLIAAINKLERSSKAIGNSHYFSLQREFQGTMQASCGTAKDFKAVMLSINRQLIAMNPKYGKPTWEINL